MRAAIRDVVALLLLWLAAACAGQTNQEFDVRLREMAALLSGQQPVVAWIDIAFQVDDSHARPPLSRGGSLADQPGGGVAWIVTVLQPLPCQRYDWVLPLVTVYSTMQPCRTRVGGKPPIGIHTPQPMRW